MLCGGISVDIPTAIPIQPFSKIFGNRAGSTVGSDNVPSINPLWMVRGELYQPFRVVFDNANHSQYQPIVKPLPMHKWRRFPLI